MGEPSCCFIVCGLLYNDVMSIIKKESIPSVTKFVYKKLGINAYGKGTT